MNRTLLESVIRRVAPMATDGWIADADLLQRFAADRDELAFGVLVRRHGPLVWAVCRQMLSHEPDAEDAFQATFLALIRSAGTVRTPAALGAWLHGVAFRVAMKAKRTAARRHQRERAAAASEAADPVSEAAWHELQLAVHEEVNRLPEPLRTAFVICELEGTGQREAAAALGCKIGTLSGRLTKARHRLLDRLSRRGIPPGAVVFGAIAGGAAATSAAPAVLVSQALTLARSSFDMGGAISQTVLELARGATEVSMTRTKMLTAAAVLFGIFAAGTATTLIPLSRAQDNLPPTPAVPTPPTPIVPGAPKPPQPVGGFGGGGGFNGPKSAQWEYKFVTRPSVLDKFEELLNHTAAQGWEYCGTESLLATDATRNGQEVSIPTIILKRHKGGSGFAPMMPIGGPGGAAMGGGGFGPVAGGGMPPLGGGSAPVAGAPTPPPAMIGLPPAGDPNEAAAGGPGRAFGGRMKGVAGAALPKQPAKGEYLVIRLRNSQASEIAKGLSQLFYDRPCIIIAEPATNALLVRTDTDTYKAIVGVIEKIDPDSSTDRAK